MVGSDPAEPATAIAAAPQPPDSGQQVLGREVDDHVIVAQLVSFGACGAWIVC
jgi:hypothetical protein